MPRIYKPAVGPSTNKAAKPVQETKAAKSGNKENTEKKGDGDK